eukprot:GGOE01011712.1.p1 GENE.GGOE01011712.1~~GGOE01011712.1.p1  ORF type:complete len:621 (-),score=128.72 GGOE01011712.1:2407-4023(-)
MAPQSLCLSQPLSPSSPKLAHDQFPRGLMRGVSTPTSADMQSSPVHALHKSLRGTSMGLNRTQWNITSPSTPLSPGLRCKACGTQLHTKADWELHQAFKEHKKRQHDCEQRSVLVTGLPSSVSTQIVASIFCTFDIVEDAIEYIACPKSRQDKRDEGQQLTQPHWQILLRDVDEARRACKMSPLTVLGCPVNITMAIQPHHCDVCNVTVNSTQQLQQHCLGTRHQEALKVWQGSRTLTVSSIPMAATECQIIHLFEGFNVAEGGIVLDEDETNSGMQAARVTFDSQEDCQRASLLSANSPTILGHPVQIVLKQDAPPMQKIEVPKSGLKTAKEVHMLVSSLLYTHHVADLSDVTTHLFSRIHSTFMSCKPYLFVPFHPRDRFFAEFEAQAGSRRGHISLEDTRAILQQMDGEWGFQLPPGVAQWMETKVAKYCRDSESDLLPKSTFVQIRNLKWTVYQVVEQIIEKLAANKTNPPPLLHPMQPLPRTTSPSHFASYPSSSSNSALSQSFSFEPEENDCFNVDDQPWDDCTLDVAWVLE